MSVLKNVVDESEGVERELKRLEQRVVDAAKLAKAEQDRWGSNAVSAAGPARYVNPPRRPFARSC